MASKKISDSRVEDRPTDVVEDRPVDVVEDRPVDVVEDRPVDVVEDRPVDSVEDRPVVEEFLREGTEVEGERLPEADESLPMEDTKKFNSHLVREITWERIRSDRKFNIRQLDAYQATELKAMRQNIQARGLQVPFMVSDEGDGTYLILRGNRRYACMEMDRVEFLDLVRQGHADLKDMPHAKIPCEVKKGLSSADKTIFMLDHGYQRGLRPVEVFEAVLRLRKLGAHWGETRIKNQLGMERGMITTHWRVSCLPMHLHEHYRKYLTDKKSDGLKLIKENVDKLYSAFGEDVKKGSVLTVDGGPAYKETLKKIEVESKSGVSGGKNKGPSENLSAVLPTLMRPGGTLLMQFVQHMQGKGEGLPPLGDVVDNLVGACAEIYGVGEGTTVVEEGITREV